ncbi:hypothetical protein NM688_g7193 [Phlebia brevispora]|uniref:Uncharacterized protein n=1 Tax=Phlebia brevispora TaxID=194682 RepID=A0ACC1S8L4_9APHY|nr:hypothetical protein NM688_g7193 [Phlebia brevispora]
MPTPLSQRPPKVDIVIGRRITTLDPDRLTPSDYLDVSHITKLPVHIPEQAVQLNRTSSKSATYQDRAAYIGYSYSDERHLPFPEGTRGFLYYFSPPFAHPLAGQIRFRITPSSDPATFASGYDLKDPLTTLPLSWPLRRLMRSKFLRPLANLLLYDALITSELVLSESSHTSLPRVWNIATLYAFGQPFYVDFQVGESRFDVLATVDGRHTVERATVKYPARLTRRTDKEYPYHGQFRRPEEGQMLHTRKGPWKYALPQDDDPIDTTDPKRALRLLKEIPNVSYKMF